MFSIVFLRRILRVEHVTKEGTMPYKRNSDLPESVQKVLPGHAQDIYREVFNNAYDEYKKPSDRRSDTGREEAAHRVAWGAVKGKYKKGTDQKWHTK